MPFTEAVDVLPGTDVSKIVQVRNTGRTDRVDSHFARRIHPSGRGVEGEADTSLISYDLNTDAWTEKDGYYYYNTALEPDETTEPLFTKVTFSAAMSNLYQHSKAIINVGAQATQKGKQRADRV